MQWSPLSCWTHSTPSLTAVIAQSLLLGCCRMCDPSLPAGADLDHANDRLRSSLVDWMNWLKTDIGFEAWRFDFVKVRGSLHSASMRPGCPACCLVHPCKPLPVKTVCGACSAASYWLQLSVSANLFEPRRCLCEVHHVV